MRGKLPRTKLLTLTLALALTACVALPTPATDVPIPTLAPSTQVPSITLTPDPCAPENIEAEVQKVHRFMREFDDASSLAASRPREELGDAIAELQRIRRDTEDQPTPNCLADLRTFQVSHMNTVINTLIAFMGQTDQQVVDNGIALARQQHDRYTLELARLLGLTVVPATVLAPPTLTPTP